MEYLLILCKLPIIFSTVKLKHKYSQYIHRFKIGIFCIGLRLVILPSFSQLRKRFFDF